VICGIWDRVQRRNAEYIRFRRHQLRSIEARLPELATFNNTHLAFERGESIHFRGIDESFALKRSARRSSTLTEGVLPRALIALWLLALLATLAWTAVG
jgi:hypothetical protein